MVEQDETAEVVEVISRMNPAGEWEATATLRGYAAVATAEGPSAAAKRAGEAVTLKADAHRMAGLPDGVSITRLYAKDEDVDSFAISADLSNGERISVGYSWVTAKMAERMAQIVGAPLQFC